MPTLHDIIRRMRNRQTDQSDWLYIAGPSVDLSLETDADLGCPEFDEETDEEIDPVGYEERGLRSTIDVDSVMTCIE